MNTKASILLLVTVFFLTGCIAKSDPDNLNHISLTASVAQMTVDLKSAQSKATVTPQNLPFTAKLLFSSDAAKFPFVQTPVAPSYIPCHTEVTYSGSDFEFIKYGSNNLTYPADGGTVYCSGLYPKDNWTIDNDGSSATFNIDGTTDIMFADIIQGSWTNPFSTPQDYKHLQTWIKVLVSSNTNDAADKWGKVIKITVKSEPYVQIQFGNKADKSSTVSYPAEETAAKDIEVYNSGSATDGTQLSITTEELGSVFIVPPTALLNMVVYTTTFPQGRPVKVKLYDLENNKEINDRDHTVGKLFVINLNFTNLDVIEGVCTLNYWNDQDDDLYLE